MKSTLLSALLGIALILPSVTGVVASAQEGAPPGTAPASDARAIEDEVRARALRFGLSSEIVAKLTADQIADVLETQSYGANPPWGTGTTRVVASLGFFVSIVGIVGLLLWFGDRRDRQRHATLRMLIEKGAPLPPGLLLPPIPPRAPT